jgi:hypothetical protein
MVEVDGRAVDDDRAAGDAEEAAARGERGERERERARGDECGPDRVAADRMRREDGVLPPKSQGW